MHSHVNIAPAGPETAQKHGQDTSRGSPWLRSPGGFSWNLSSLFFFQRFTTVLALEADYRHRVESKEGFSCRARFHKRRSRLGESTAGLKIRSGLSKRDVFTLQYSTTEICSLGSTPLYVAFTCVSFEIHQLATSNVCSQFGFNYFQDPTFYCRTSETDHRSMFHTFTF